MKLKRSQAKQETCGRRDFSRTLVALAGVAYAGSLAVPVCRYLGEPARQRREAAQASVMRLEGAASLPPGTAKYFLFGAEPAMIIHYGDDTWAAFNAHCTHLRCTVQYQPGQNRIFCACHEGVFDAKTGANVSGPPPAPLKAYALHIEDADVIVSREEGATVA